MQYIANNMRLPSASEINVYNSPDERLACEHFLNKTLSQAEKLFSDNSALYQEDLMWMGLKAFHFYLQAVINYLQSDDAIGDDHFIDCLYEIMMFRLNRENFLLSVDIVDNMINYIISNYKKFSVDEEIYGVLKDKYVQLQNKVRKVTQT